jgi:hypothetical protein
MSLRSWLIPHKGSLKEAVELRNNERSSLLLLRQLSPIIKPISPIIKAMTHTPILKMCHFENYDF